MGALQDNVIQLLAAEGIEVAPPRSFEWLTSRGHLNPSLCDQVSRTAINLLVNVYRTLGGDERLLKRKKNLPLRPDFVLNDGRDILEIDELQHFTTDRRKTLAHYSSNYLRVVAGYEELIDLHCAGADRYRQQKPAIDFPFPGGRRAQRAYFDTLRDVLAVEMGIKLIRIPAPERDAALARKRFMEAVN